MQNLARSAHCQPGTVLLLLVILMAIPASVMSQEPVFEEFHTWTDVATIYNFDVKFRYDGDYGVRGLLTDSNWTLVYLRPSVRYKSKSWMSLHGGAALFYNFFGDTEDLPELRPWVGARFTWPRPGGFTVTHYLRLELRAFYYKEDSRWDVWLRGRYQLQVVTPTFSMAGANRFYGITSVEPFEDFSSDDVTTFGDRFRFNLGIGKHVSDDLRIDLNYVFHTVRLSDARGDFEFDDHVARLRFFYSFN